MSTSPADRPHADRVKIAIDCAVITVSDTRTAATDTSGGIIRELLMTAGHRVDPIEIIPDEATLIAATLDRIAAQTSPIIRVVIFNGGTGIAPRDTTYDAIASLLTKTLPGFGELFRSLSYAEIGSRAMTSRAIAGVYHNLLVFSVPGSSNAVRLAMEKLILPELIHLTGLIQP
jgi:molybdopterin adenylyltransferase